MHTFTAAQIAKELDGQVVGEGSTPLTGFAPASAAKPGDPPLLSFPAKVSLGPSDMKNVKVLVQSKLRVYELPDWQFLTADFQISD